MPDWSWRVVLLLMCASAMLRPAEREFVVRQGIPASESALAARGSFVSGDGRFVAIVSMAALLPEDRHPAADLYVLDRETSTLTLETPALDREASHGSSRHPGLSDDGRYVVFESDAADLVRGAKVNRATHVFVRDRLLQTTIRISKADANHVSDAPVISGDGRVVAFDSRATNLLAGVDENGNFRDVHVVWVGTNVASRANVRSDGRQPSDGESHSPNLSGDGRFVAFTSTSDLRPPAPEPRDPKPPGRAIYVRDLLNGNTSCASCSGGLGKGSASQPHLSADARFVVFVWQPDRGPRSPRVRTDIVLHDRSTSTTTVITRRANATSTRPRLSANGRYIAFETLASNLVCDKQRCPEGTGDENLLTDVYLFDRLSGQFIRVSGGSEEWWVPSIGASINREGTVIAFSTRQPLDVNDPTTDFDVFVTMLPAAR